MCNKIIAILSILIAVVLAILAVALPAEDVTTIIIISRFFEVMIPVLAVGALIKYLFTYTHKEG